MYTIKLLESSKFNRLPYKDVDKSFGLADYRNKKAFVRQSGIPALDVLITGHELEELTAKVSPHEEDGIRYKKGGDIITSALPVIVGAALAPFTAGTSLAFLPAAAGAVTGGIQGYQTGGWGGAATGGALGGLGGYGGAQMLTGGIAGGTAAGPGALSKAGGIAQGALFGTTGGGSATQSLLGPGGSSTGLFSPSASTGIGGFAGNIGKNATASAMSNTLMSSLSPAASYTPLAQQYASAYTPASYGMLGGYGSSLLGGAQTIAPTPGNYSGGGIGYGARSYAGLGGQSPYFNNMIPAYSRTPSNIYTF